MAVYTTEVRTIVESYTGQMRQGASAIDKLVADATPLIFNDTWDTFNHDHKQELCEKILKHYYFREIGYETVPLWSFALNRKLAEIMPKYNKMYEIVEKAYVNPLNIYDMMEEQTDSNNQNAESTNESVSDSGSKTTGENVADSTSKSAAESNSTSTAEAWQKYNDTPQGGIQGLDSDTYLTNATKNVSDSTGTTDNTSTSESHSSGTSTSTSTSNSTSKSTNKGIVERLHDMTRHVHGINGTKSYAELAKQAMDMYVNVDMEIIRELEPLFMQLW